MFWKYLTSRFLNVAKRGLGPLGFGCSVTWPAWYCTHGNLLTYLRLCQRFLIALSERPGRLTATWMNVDEGGDGSCWSFGIGIGMPLLFLPCVVICDLRFAICMACDGLGVRGMGFSRNLGPMIAVFFERFQQDSGFLWHNDRPTGQQNKQV